MDGTPSVSAAALSTSSSSTARPAKRSSGRAGTGASGAAAAKAPISLSIPVAQRANMIQLFKSVHQLAKLLFAQACTAAAIAGQSREQALARAKEQLHLAAAKQYISEDHARTYLSGLEANMKANEGDMSEPLARAAADTTRALQALPCGLGRQMEDMACRFADWVQVREQYGTVGISGALRIAATCQKPPLHNARIAIGLCIR